MLDPWFLVPYAAWFGGATASFLGVVADRGWRGAAIGKRSNCICGRQLRWWENLPVVGFVLLRGRAQCCGARIPARYVLTELGMAACVGAAAWFGIVPALAATFVSGFVVLPASRRFR